jgi:hypothetical protein
MKTIQCLSVILICCLVYLCTSGCATSETTTYSAKGSVLSTTKERKPDYVFWKGAGKVAVTAAEIALAQKAAEVDTQGK